MNRFRLKYFIIVCNVLLISALEYSDDNGYQKILSKEHSQNSSVLITKLLNIDQRTPSILSTTEVTAPHAFKINQSLDVEQQNINSNKSDDQSISAKNLPKPKYVNKSASSSDKKNTLLLRKNLSLSQSKLLEDGSWMCPNITDNKMSIECGCDVPLTLRCSGDVHGLSLIAEGLRKSSSIVSILDCTLRNVTVLNEARIFEDVALTGLFISSGEIKRLHRLAFSGLKTPLQILGLPNNALTSVPSDSLQQLPSLDRLDLSNNEIKVLSFKDFVPLQKLTYLELSENQISSISQKTFLPLKNLVTLKLNGNKLGNSPGSLKTLAECVNLRELDLKSNLIKGSLSYDMLPVIKELEMLNLEKNSFSSVQSKAFKNYPKLVSLSLNHNQIDVISDDAFYGLSSLQKLDLSYNGIVAVSEGSLKHMPRLVLLDFTHNFLRAITADIISPLPQLKELRLDGNDIAIIEKNALVSAKNLKILSLRDNPLACDCKLQYFAEWLSNTTQISSDELMAFCKTPPFLEGAQLSQLEIEKLTCAEVSHLESPDTDQIMQQINNMYNDFLENFTLVNSSHNIKFLDYNFTTPNILNLNWLIHLKKNIEFHSLIIFEGSNIRTRLDGSMLSYRPFLSTVSDEEFFYVTVPSRTPFDLGNSYEFCLIFSEDNYQFFVGCSNSFLLTQSHAVSVDLNSRGLQSSSSHDSDISSFDVIASKKDDQMYLNDDMMRSTSYSTLKTNSVKKVDPLSEHDDSIDVYPSEGYYNTLWPNLSLSFLIICMSISIIYILYSKYRYYYKHTNHSDNSISPSYSDDSINTASEENNHTNKYVKLQATTAL